MFTRANVGQSALKYITDPSQQRKIGLCNHEKTLTKLSYS